MKFWWWCLLPTVAWAEPARIALIPTVIAGEQNADPAALYRALEEAAADRPGLAPSTYAQIFLEGAEPLVSAARNCGADLPCLSRALRFSGFKLGLVAIANLALDPPVLTFSLVDAEAARSLEEGLGDVLPGTSIPVAVGRGAEALLERAGHPRGARLTLLIDPPDAQVRLNGASSIESGPRRVWLLPAGSHVIEAWRQDYQPVRVERVLASAEAQQLELRLTKVETSNLAHSPWFWGLVGLAAAGAATAIVLAVDPFGREPTPTCLCVNTTGGVCPPCP